VGFGILVRKSVFADQTNSGRKFVKRGKLDQGRGRERKTAGKESKLVALDTCLDVFITCLIDSE
jgi:hypothetical protein